MPLEQLERNFTTRRLERRLGNKTDIVRFLELLAWNTSQGPWQGGDDFQGDTLWGGYQSTASGTVAAAAAISTGVVNGAILLDVGTDNAGRSDLSWGLHYQAQLNAVFVARFKVPVITTRKFEIGFTDVISGTDAGALNSKAGNTWTADNAAILAFDTSDDTNVSLMGVKATTAATPVDLTFTMVADTYYYMGVALLGGEDSAIGFVLNADGAAIQTAQARITSPVSLTALLTPWLFVQNRAGNAGSMTVDWLCAYQRRTTTV